MRFRPKKTSPMQWLRLTLLAVGLLLPTSGRFAAAQTSPAQNPSATASPALDLRLPLKADSIRFAVIGDSGTGERPQYEIAELMEAYRRVTKFDFVIMLGDNIYGGHHAIDFQKKFEEPYKSLLD